MQFSQKAHSSRNAVFSYLSKNFYLAPENQHIKAVKEHHKTHKKMHSRFYLIKLWLQDWSSSAIHDLKSVCKLCGNYGSKYASGSVFGRFFSLSSCNERRRISTPSLYGSCKYQFKITMTIHGSRFGGKKIRKMRWKKNNFHRVFYIFLR